MWVVVSCFVLRPYPSEREGLVTSTKQSITTITITALFVAVNDRQIPVKQPPSQKTDPAWGPWYACWDWYTLMSFGLGQPCQCQPRRE